ncbi:MAG: IPT/TIG domain-containing protein [Candidatus Sericytochromatia bacterium]|nr:IPT/TIG domain-containing protein [Candidatus Sericytochromatia bacterium]
MRRIPPLLVSLALLTTLTACPPIGTTGGRNAMSLSLDAQQDRTAAPGLQVRFRTLALPAVWDRAEFVLSSPSLLHTPVTRTVDADDMTAVSGGALTANRLFPLVPPGSDYALRVRLFDGPTQVSGAVLDNLTIGAFSTVITATVSSLTNPVITGFQPSMALGRPGDTLHVLGTGFGTTTGHVTLHDQPMTVSQWSDTDITVVIPTNATSGMIVITAPGGTTSTGRPFAVRRDELFLIGQQAGLQTLSLANYTAMSGFPAQTGAGPGRMVHDAGRDRLYGVLEGSKQLAVLNAATLAPVPGSPFAVDGTPGGVAYDPTSDRIFVTCVDTGKVTILSAGSLQPVSGSPMTLGGTAVPNAIIATAGKVFWINQGAGTLQGINAATLAPLAGSPVSVGINPVALAYDASRSRIGVIAQVNSALILLNAHTLQVVGQGSTGPAPADLVFDPTSDRYVATAYNGGGVQSFDPVSAAGITSQIVTTGPVSLAADPGHGRLLVTHGQTDQITGLNLPGLDLLPGMPIPVGRGPKAVTYDPAHDRFWVANQGSSQWALLGRAGFDLLQAGPVSTGITADMSAYDSTRHRLYVAQREGRTLEAVDAATGQILRQFRAPLGTSPGPIAYDWRHDQIAVANRGSGTLQAFRAGTFAPVTGSPLTVGTSPVQVRYEPMLDRFYVLSQQSHDLHAFDAATLAPISGSPVTTGPQPLDVLSAADGQTLFVLSRGSNAVEVYTAATLAKTASYALGGTATAMAADISRSRLYALVTGVGLIGLSATTGQALPGSPWTIGPAVQQLLFDPVADRLYGLDAANRQLDVRAGNTMAPVPGSPFATGLTATSMLIAQ